MFTYIIYNNLPKIIWNSPDQTTGADEIHFTELLNDHFLSQVNRQPTRGNNILDLVINSVLEKVQVDAILQPQESRVITDHNCLVFHVKVTVKASVKLNRYVYDYQKGDFEGLRSTLQNIDFHNIVENNIDVNAAWLEWKERLIAEVRNFIPMRKIKGKSSPPWITGPILYMIRKKECLRMKLKSLSSSYLIAKLRQLRSTVKRTISESRARYFETLEQDIQSNSKRFWSAFKLSDKASCSVPHKCQYRQQSKTRSQVNQFGN